MLDCISYGPPTGPAPSNQAGQNNTALAADIANGALYVSVPGGIWKPAGAGLVAALSLTGQTSASNVNSLYTPTGVTSGMYSLDFYTKLTTTGTSPVLGPFVVTYKDNVDSTAQTVTVAGQTQAGTNATSLTATTTAQIFSGSVIINAGPGAAISSTLTVSGTIGAAVYELYIRVEFLG